MMVRTAASTSVRLGLWVAGCDARRSSMCTIGFIGMPFHSRGRSNAWLRVEAHWMIREQNVSPAHAYRPCGAERRRLRSQGEPANGRALSTQDRSVCPIAPGRDVAWCFRTDAEDFRGIVDTHSLDRTLKKTVR